MNTVTRFLDEFGKIKQIPSKEKVKLLVLDYLASKFSFNRDYTEKEVNAIIENWHTFSDYFVLRRELIDFQYLCRTSDGARYWRTNTKLHYDQMP